VIGSSSKGGTGASKGIAAATTARSGVPQRTSRTEFVPPATTANPWTALGAAPPFILREDEGVFKRHPRFASRFDLRLPPVPFVGHPWSARVLILTRNPGLIDKDVSDLRDAAYRSEMLANVRFESTYPFVFLEPRFERTAGGAWWRNRLSALLSAVGAERVARGVFALYWFPYHSRRFAPPPETVPSQAFAFDLAEQAIESGKLVVVMHAESLWLSDVPALQDAEILRVKSNRAASISPTNMQESDFGRVVDALR
jgi:hypothetical protein